MSEERAPQGENINAWVPGAVRVLVGQRAAIEEKLRADRRLDDFHDRMKQWQNAYLGERAFELVRCATALYQICDDFGLMPMLQEQYSVGGLRVREVRRGISAPAGQGVQEQLKEVARLYAGG